MCFKHTFRLPLLEDSQWVDQNLCSVKMTSYTFEMTCGDCLIKNKIVAEGLLKNAL